MQGITGRGIVVGIVDDGEPTNRIASVTWHLSFWYQTGVDWQHPALKQNYVSSKYEPWSIRGGPRQNLDKICALWKSFLEQIRVRYLLTV